MKPKKTVRCNGFLGRTLLETTIHMTVELLMLNRFTPHDEKHLQMHTRGTFYQQEAGYKKPMLTLGLVVNGVRLVFDFGLICISGIQKHGYHK